MLIENFFKFIRTAGIPESIMLNILLFLILILILVALKIARKVNPALRNSRVIWIIMIPVLPLLILSGESVLNFLLTISGINISVYLGKISYILLLFAGGSIILNAFNIFFWNNIQRKNNGEPVPKILTNFLSAIVYLIVIYMSLTLVLELRVTGLVVSSGIIAGVLGLSMQSILSDLIAGIAIALEKPYRIGDWIEFRDGTLGEVTDINWRTTRLLSWKNSVYVVPNGKATQATLHNYSLPDKYFRTVFHVAISPEVHPDMARRILLEAALSCNSIIKDPTPVIRLMDIEKKPYRYMVSATYQDYASHFSGRDQLMINIWTGFRKTGMESSGDISEVHISEKRPMQISDPGISELLKDIALFRTLSESELEKLSSDAEIVLYRAGEYISEEGMIDSSLLLVTAGVVSVSHRSDEGNSIELARFGLGESLGETSLLTGEPRNSDITAVTDCQIVKISKESMEEIIRNRPEILEDLADIMARRKLEHESKLNISQRRSTSELLSSYAIEMINSMKSFFRI